MKSIDSKSLLELHNNTPAQLLDVRTPVEFEAAHISGSKLIALDSLDCQQVRTQFDVSKPIYVICRTGNRAQQAIQKLKAEAIDSAVLLEGGIEAWQQQKLPLKLGRKSVSLDRQVRIAAGVLIVLGAALGFLINPLWHILSGFVGAGLTFAGLTDSCAMGMLIARMPWNQRKTAYSVA